MTFKSHNCHGCSSIGLQRSMGCTLPAAQSYWDMREHEDFVDRALELLAEEIQRRKASAKKGGETRKRRQFDAVFSILVAENIMREHTTTEPQPLLEHIMVETVQQQQMAR